MTPEIQEVYVACSLLAHVALGPATSVAACDALLAVTMGTVDGHKGHGPLLAAGHSQDQAQCAMHRSVSPRVQHSLGPLLNSARCHYHLPRAAAFLVEHDRAAAPGHTEAARSGPRCGGAPRGWHRWHCLCICSWESPEGSSAVRGWQRHTDASREGQTMTNAHETQRPDLPTRGAEGYRHATAATGMPVRSMRCALASCRGHAGAAWGVPWAARASPPYAPRGAGRATRRR